MRKPTAGDGGHHSGAAANSTLPPDSTVLDAPRVTPADPADTLAHALAWARAGYAVFPCRPDPDRPGMTEEQRAKEAKRPDADRAPHGFRDATTDEATIRRWFVTPANLAVATHALVPEIDAPKASERPGATEAQRIAEAVERYEYMAERFPEIAAAPLIRSRSGGFHPHLRPPLDAPALSTGAWYGPDGETWGHVRGLNNAYLMVPPSVAGGRAYTLERPPVPFDKLPRASLELWEALGRKPSRDEGESGPVGAVGIVNTSDAREIGEPEGYARGLLQGTHDRLAVLKEGNRHDETRDEAAVLGRWVAGYERAGLPGLTEQDARKTLEAASRTNEYLDDDPDEARRTIREGLRFGMARPYRVTVKPHADSGDQGTRSREASADGGNDAPSQARAHATGGGASPPAPPAGGAAASSEYPAPPDLGLLDYEQDDGGLADMFAHLHYPEVRYHVGRSFLAWDGQRHVTGEAAEIEANRRALRTVRSLKATAQQIEDDKQRRKWEKFAQRASSGRSREAMLSLARGTRIRAQDEEIDADPAKINTPEGVLDLRTLEVHPHDPRNVHTAVTRARYRPEATHEAWDAMLALLDQDGRREYMQRALGQALTGLTHRGMFLLHGPKATGKTSLTEAIAHGLGPDYAVTVDPSTLLSLGKQSAGGARADLVALVSARMALSSEPESGAKLDGPTVKRLTGGDNVTARAPYARTPITFRPTFTIYMLANDVPRADWSDEALLDRLKLVPFRARPVRPDPRVREALLSDQDAVDAAFTWAARGAQAWLLDNLSMGDEPEVVTAAAREYRTEQDPFALWAEERLRFDQPDAEATVGDLHTDYTRWAQQNAVTEPERAEALGKWLRAQGEAGRQLERTRVTSGPNKGRRVWRGVRLIGPTG